MSDDLRVSTPTSGEPQGSGPSRALVLIEDLMFSSKARSTLESLRMEAVPLRSAQDLAAAFDGEAALLIVDLGAGGLEPLVAIRKAKEKGMAVLAFGSHVDLDALENARRAGADEVVPRSTFSARLPDLIRGLVDREGAR